MKQDIRASVAARKATWHSSISSNTGFEDTLSDANSFRKGANQPVKNSQRAPVTGTDGYYLTALGSGSFAEMDLPLVPFVRIFLTPVVVLALALLLSVFDHNAISGSYTILAALLSATSALVFGEVNFYRESDGYPIRSASIAILTRWAIVVAILVLFAYVAGYHAQFSPEILVAGAAVAPLTLLSAHMLTRSALSRLLLSRASRTAIMVGANQLGSALNRRIKEDPFLNVKVAGFFDDRRGDRIPRESPMRRLGSLEDVPEYLQKHSVEIVYLCLPMMWQDRMLTLLDELRDTTASIYYVPDVFIADLIQGRGSRIGGIPIIAICETPFVGARALVKRMTDVVVSLLIILLTWPVLVLIAIGVKLSSPGGVLYKQERYGLDGKRIVVYKYRTMFASESSDDVVQARQDDQRVTPFGRFLRRTSLDELPQLINVLQGNMSIVGPRPHAVVHNEIYRKAIRGYMLRHKVKPGITGWAQINGFRGETDTLEKMKARVAYDLDYLRNWSLTLDFAIMLKSLRVVFGDAKAY